MDPGIGRDRCAGPVSPDTAGAEVSLPATQTLLSHLSFLDIIPFLSELTKALQNKALLYKYANLPHASGKRSSIILPLLLTNKEVEMSCSINYRLHNKDGRR